jgi:hypothetical protein
MILAGSFDTVFYARRNENVVALSRSSQDHNPFGPGLIVPKPWRTLLAHGDDPLDPRIAGFEEAETSMSIAVRSVEQVSGQR